MIIKHLFHENNIIVSNLHEILEKASHYVKQKWI